MLFDATLQQGLEGIVSKRLTSRYVFGERTRNWLKFAHRHRRSYVVGGWRPQEGTTDRLAALLVGEPTERGARLPRPGRQRHRRRGQPRRSPSCVTPIARADSPFDDEVPRVDARGTLWVEPVLVVDVETHGRPRYAAAAPAVVPRRPHRPVARRPAIARSSSRKSARVLARRRGLPPRSGTPVHGHFFSGVSHATCSPRAHRARPPPRPPAFLAWLAPLPGAGAAVPDAAACSTSGHLGPGPAQRLLVRRRPGRQPAARRPDRQDDADRPRRDRLQLQGHQHQRHGRGRPDPQHLRHRRQPGCTSTT